MAQTRTEIDAHFPLAIAEIAYNYFASSDNNAISRGECGEFELCCQITDENAIDLAVEGCVRGGHLELLQVLLGRGAALPDKWAYTAAQHGHWETFHFLASDKNNEFGREDLEVCLVFALSNGKVDFARKLCANFSDVAPNDTNTDDTKSVLESERVLESLAEHPTLFCQLLTQRNVEAIEFVQKTFGLNCPFDRASFEACLDQDEDRIVAMIADNKFDANCCLSLVAQCHNKKITSMVIDNVLDVPHHKFADAMADSIRNANVESLILLLPHVKMGLTFKFDFFCNDDLGCETYLLKNYANSWTRKMVDAFESGRAESIQLVIDLDPEFHNTQNGICVLGPTHKSVDALQLLFAFLRKLELPVEKYIDVAQSLKNACTKMSNGALFLPLLLALPRSCSCAENSFICGVTMTRTLTRMFKLACSAGNLECVKILSKHDDINIHEVRKGLFRAHSHAQCEVATFLRELLSPKRKTISQQ